MTEALFDKSLEYDAMLARGLAVTGDDKAYFMRGRVQNMVGRLPGHFKPAKILDFGCGLGETSHELSRLFPSAEITGIDTAKNAIEYARKNYGSEQIKFSDASTFDAENVFDLCYVNGVFHHIEPENRGKVLKIIYRALKPGGYFGFYENNPWNPGTHLVMSRIAFDRDAKTLSHLQAEKLLVLGGFKPADRTEFIFYFPKWFSFLRFMDSALVKVPLGAQYGVLAVKS